MAWARVAAALEGRSRTAPAAASTAATATTASRAGSRMNIHTSAAQIRPGTAATKKAPRQLKASASAVRMTGPKKDPMRLLPRFCITPMLKPRRDSEDSSTTRDCATGRMGPSARPISMREASSTPKDGARPESTEHTEKITTVMISTDLRRPSASESVPTRKPEIAQQIESPEDSAPTWPLVRCSEAVMNGARLPIALRSKNTKPNISVRTPIIRIS